MHNYLKKINQMVQSGAIQPEGVKDIDIAHDSWCGIYKGNDCNCECEITVRKERP
jgi:hypothetical protein